MGLALFDPEGGYYTDEALFGPAGDYFTSPATHPAFGALVAVQLQRMWEVLGHPARFTVVEMGAGNGLLASDVVEYAAGMSSDFSGCLNYVAVDRFRPADESKAPDGAHRIIADGVPLSQVTGCFLSNELVDSFPVHRFQIHLGAVNEIYVALNEDGAFTEVVAEPSTPLLAGRIEELALSLPDGFRGEVNLGIPPWLSQVSNALKRGFVVTIDYGYEAAELYSQARAGGTLQTYYRHTQGGSPYQRVGRQDITAHVDFSALGSAGNSLGLQLLGLPTQARFLRDLGFEAMRQKVRGQGLGDRERNANTMAMLELVKPEGLGGFKVLVQERGTGVTGLGQLAPAESVLGQLDVPPLGPRHMPLMEGRYPHLEWDPGDLWPFGREEP
ncbi:MAG: SAM-dependent methyltransferase [SAR202 cluster bacterium]|nr:SAM-dependent methyltransferase [SAR202 cluster bacterium]